MKNLIAAIFLFSCYCSFAQITGTVKNHVNEPVEFATVLNIKTKASSITNKEGIFHLVGNVGDSIRIQHLNYNTEDFAIQKLNDNYLLSEKNYNLGEVVVSANYAARLFELSCRKTYEKLKDKNVSRGYLRNIVKANNDTTQLIDIDLDIEQQKQKSFNQKEKILPYKVQERIVKDSLYSSKIGVKQGIFPKFNSVIWDGLENYFNYFEVQDAQFIKLYFLNKQSFKDSVTHIEVTIQKSDSCLYSFALISKNLLKNKKGETLKMQTKSFHYFKYDYKDGFSYLLESKSGVILTNPEFGEKDFTVLQFFKTYNNGASNLEKRSNGTRIFYNSLEPRLIKNKYDEEFWKSGSYLKMEPYDFEYLLNLDLGDN